jgi:hypothetical protein
MNRGERLDPADFAGRYERWIELITENHHAANPRVVQIQQFTPLKRALSDAKIALVSSAGVHLDDQAPFHVETVAGDPSHRLIPDDVDLARLRFTHTHYDTASAQADSNVVFPLDRLHEAADAGRIGSTSSVHIGMMGFNPDPTAIAEKTAPAVAEILVAEEVDVVVLVPG